MNNMNSNPANLGLIRTIFLSVSHRDTQVYPSSSDFVVDLPATINHVHGVAVRNFKYTPEPLINANNNVFTFDVDGGSTTGTLRLSKGDYSQSITELLAEINNLLNAYDVHFMVNPDTQKIDFTFSGSYVNSYFAIPACKLLKLLGFPGGICLHRTGATFSTPAGTTRYETSAGAAAAFKIVNDTDLIVRITDIEAILSVNSVCNRATAILLSSRSPESVVEQSQYMYSPLLQTQQRVQRLRLKILNSDGDLYDLNGEDASFAIDFYCGGHEGGK